MYKVINLENGNILLQKIMIDNTKYTIIDQDNGDKLLIKINQININDINDIKNHCFGKCFVNDKELEKLKYKSILVQIYKLIDDGVIIIKQNNQKRK